MAMVLWYMLMGLSILVSGRMIVRMGKGNGLIIEEMFMKDSW